MDSSATHQSDSPALWVRCWRQSQATFLEAEAGFHSRLVVNFIADPTERNKYIKTQITCAYYYLNGLYLP